MTDSMIDKISKLHQRPTILCLAALCFAATASAQTSAWKSYPYPADGFQASYPSTPEISRTEIPTDAGSFQLHTYIVEVGDTALFIGVCDYGPKTDGKDPQNLLQGAKNGALQTSSSHIVSEKKITLGDYPGLEFETENGSAHITARIYMVGNVLYQELVIAPLDKPFPDVTRFLDSFQLIPKVAN